MPFVPEARHQESRVLIWLCGFGYFTPASPTPGPFPKGLFLVQVFNDFSVTTAFVQMNCIWNP